MSCVIERGHFYLDTGISYLGCSVDDVLTAVEECSHPDQIIVSFGLRCASLRCSWEWTIGHESTLSAVFNFVHFRLLFFILSSVWAARSFCYYFLRLKKMIAEIRKVEGEYFPDIEFQSLQFEGMERPYNKSKYFGQNPESKR